MVTTSSDPHLGAIRLAWWRERLEEFDEGKSAPPEPRLQAVEQQLLPRGVSGAQLSRLEDAWLPLLEPFPWDEPQVDGLKLRGRILFGTGAELLGGAAREAEDAGAFWSLVDGAQHCSDASSRAVLLSAAKRVRLDDKIPPGLRPLSVLAALAAADLRRRGNAFARGLAALRHRVTGRFPPVG